MPNSIGGCRQNSAERSIDEGEGEGEGRESELRFEMLMTTPELSTEMLMRVHGHMYG